MADEQEVDQHDTIGDEPTENVTTGDEQADQPVEATSGGPAGDTE